MVATILPLYLVFTLGFTPLQFGVVDGYQRGAAALVQPRRRPLRRPAPAPQGGRDRRLRALGDLQARATSPSAARSPRSARSSFADRIGKGIRTAPRDAMISLSSRPRRTSALAFGVHRALDTTGAMIGPLLAFGLLAVAPDDFDVDLHRQLPASRSSASACIVLLVDRRPTRWPAPSRPSPGGAVAPAGAAPRFRALLVAAGLSAWRRSATRSSTCGCSAQADLDTDALPAALHRDRRSPTCSWPCRSGGSPTASGASGLHRRLRAAARLYALLLLPTGGGLALIGYLLASRRLLRRDRRRARARSAARACRTELQATGLALLLDGDRASRGSRARSIFGALWTRRAASRPRWGLRRGLVVGHPWSPRPRCLRGARRARPSLAMSAAVVAGAPPHMRSARPSTGRMRRRGRRGDRRSPPRRRPRRRDRRPAPSRCPRRPTSSSAASTARTPQDYGRVAFAPARRPRGTRDADGRSLRARPLRGGPRHLPGRGRPLPAALQGAILAPTCSRCGRSASPACRAAPASRPTGATARRRSSSGPLLRRRRALLDRAR